MRGLVRPRWQVAQDGRADGRENMARDVALLERAERGEAAARLYEWGGAWVSLGRFQDAARDLLEPDLVPWVMRPTGGKAVLHGHDLTVALASPLEPGATLKGVYRALVAPLVLAFRSLGIRAALGEESLLASRGPRTADCFSHVAPNDIVDLGTGRKLAGCALRMCRTAVLAQCSIPVGLPVVDPARLYRHAHVAVPLGCPPARLREAVECHLLAEG